MRVATASEDALTTRWFSLDDASVGIRPVFETNSSGTTTTDALQYHDFFSGRFFFDPEQKYTLAFTVGNGDAFPGGWSNTGVGSGSASASSYLKQFYLDAKPTSVLEVQWGGIGLERGVSTAITSYSNDGFMAGERLYVRDPGQLFFDKASMTFGYLGDITMPDVWDRARALWMNNYQQYLVEKDLGRTAVSTDYTVVAGARTWREAVKVNVAQSKFVDCIQTDFYERTNAIAAAGGNISAAKSLNKRFGVTAGYAAIDRNYGDLNDDAFFHGRRAYVAANFHLGAGFAVSPMFDHGIGNSYALPNDSHFHLAFTYDLLAALRTAK